MARSLFHKICHPKQVSMLFCEVAPWKRAGAAERGSALPRPPGGAGKQRRDPARTAGPRPAAPPGGGAGTRTRPQRGEGPAGTRGSHGNTGIPRGSHGIQGSRDMETPGDTRPRAPRAVRTGACPRTNTLTRGHTAAEQQACETQMYTHVCTGRGTHVCSFCFSHATFFPRKNKRAKE